MSVSCFPFYDTAFESFSHYDTNYELKDGKVLNRKNVILSVIIYYRLSLMDAGIRFSRFSKYIKSSDEPPEKIRLFKLIALIGTFWGSSCKRVEVVKFMGRQNRFDHLKLLFRALLIKCFELKVHLSLSHRGCPLKFHLFRDICLLWYGIKS